jgi:cytoskeletal protein CcmA (bactofilin family)
MFFKRSKITSNDNAPVSQGRTQSLVGPDMTIDGNVVCNGELRIEGTVRGTVDAGLCVVGEGGVVEGRIMADEVVVQGTVKGPINGLHVDLQAGAQVEGDVVNGSIAVQNGAQIHGAIWHSDDPLNSRGDGAADPTPRPAAATGYLGSALWGSQDDSYRPIKVIKPR